MTVSFSPLRLRQPTNISDIAERVGGALTAVGQSISDGLADLGNLSLPPLPDLPELPSADELRQGMTTALEGAAHFLEVSPYQYGVGSRMGEAAWLTPAQALRLTAQSLGGLTVDDVTNAAAVATEEATDGDSSAMDAALVLVLTAAVDQSSLAGALGSLNKAFPLPELQKLQRRARGVADLEQSKFVVPAAPAYPPWSKVAPRQLPQARRSNRAMTTMVAQAEGIEAAGKAPADVLASFASRQQARVQQAQQELAAVGRDLSSMVDLSAWFGVYIDGAAAVAAKALANLAPPLDERFKCCTVLSWYGTRAEVAYYKELFGL